MNVREGLGPRAFAIQPASRTKRHPPAEPRELDSDYPVRYDPSTRAPKNSARSCPVWDEFGSTSAGADAELRV